MAEPAPKLKLKVLVIEDNPADVQLLQLALSSAGVDSEILLLSDGGEALAFLQRQGKYAGAPVPDIAVLDLNLPKHDGAEILQAFQSSAEFSQVPVAVLSSSAWPQERTKIEALGVARYITKPTELDQYLEIGVTLRHLAKEKQP